MKKEKPEILKKELLENAPEITKTSKENPFDVPKDYFSKLPETVQQLKNTRTQKTSRTILGNSYQNVLAYAATIAVLISFGISIIFLTQRDETNIFADIEDEYFESYFSYLADYDEALYYDILVAEEGDYLKSATVSYELWAEDIDDDYFIEYLMDYMDLYQYSAEDIANFD